MATLYVSYFASVDKHVAGDPIKTEIVTTSTTTAATGTIPANAVVAAFHSDTDHYITIGAGTPTAAITNGCYLPASFTRELRLYQHNSVALKAAAVTLA